MERRTRQCMAFFDVSIGSIKHARAFLRMTEPQKWSVDRIKDILITPWALHEPDALKVMHYKPQAGVGLVP